jgi:Kef-type K+ transport system membrane component KefB
VFSFDLPLTGPSGIFVVLFAVILVMPRLAERVRLPGLVGLVAGGIIIGPFGFGLVARDGLVAVLGVAGLLFLMFEAGLEMDRDMLRQERRQTAVFGVLTFVFPFTFGFVIHLWLDYSLLAALLLASCWSSHTLLSYPIFQRARVVGNRAVTVALGGTVITDTTALLVLVAIARVHQDDLTWGYAFTMLPLIAAAGAAIMLALPRVATWFFSSIGQERSARFLFVMVTLFGSASLAQLVGVEPIIGAFLAGLAMNRLVVPGGTLSAQISFFGSSLFTPLFMISVGMLVDPALLFSDSQTLQRAAGFTLAVVAGKAAAAAITGRAFGWRRAEVGALFSLSVAQAAATLAAVFVGFEIELLDDSTVNAVILVILVSCVLSSIAGSAVAARLPQPPTRVDRLGKRVIVPMSTPDGTDQAIVFASALAAADTGTVLPLTVLDLRTSPTEVRELREQMVTGVERTVLARGADARGEVRLDSSPGAGVLHAAVEQDATCIVMGWKGWATRRESFFGEHVDALLLGSPVPALVVRSTAGGVVGNGRHVVLALDDSDLRADGRPGALIAAAAAERIATAMKLPIVICRASDQLPSDLVKGQIVERVVTGDGGDIIELLQDNTRAGDIVIKGLPTTEARLGSQFARLLRSLGGRTFIAASPTRVGNAMQPPI